MRCMMKLTEQKNRILLGVVISVLVVTALICSGIFLKSSHAAAEPKRVDVLFTHDTHSHLESFSTLIDGKDMEVGGFARLSTLIQQGKAKHPEALLLDAGDFSMGTLVQTIFKEEAAEIRMLGMLGYDATTLGNHEFDYRSKGLAQMLDSARNSGDPLPGLIVSNIDWAAMEKKGLSEEQKLLKDALDAYGACEYKVFERNGVKIGVFGIFGEDSLACAPTCVLKFRPAAAAAKDVIKKMKAEADVDMVVCISHGGTWDDKDKSEDELLAKAVPDIDLIISGHTHTRLKKPIRHGDTYIVSSAEYVKYLGSLAMEQKANGRWEMKEYNLQLVTMDIAEDPAVVERIQDFMKNVDSNYLAQYGYSKDQVVAENAVTFCTVSDLEEKHVEGNLGSIMADAYVYAVEHASNYDGHPVDVAVCPAGTVRDTYVKGNITVEKVFNSFSLGIGRDEIPGYPLLDVYLTGEELMLAAEVDATVSDLMHAARLYMSGLHFTYNPHRLVLNKVTDCYLKGADGKRVEIKKDKLYRVVTDLYSGQMLGAVTDLSFGLLSIVPKDANGNPIEDLEDAIIMVDGQELKAWTAIAGYMESFEDIDGNGIPNVPMTYDEPQGRKVVEDSWNIWGLIKKPNKYAFMILAVLLIVLIIVIALIVLIVKIIKKIVRKCKAKKESAAKSE